MTTTITITTHSWPVEMETTDCYRRSMDADAASIIHIETETIPAHSERIVHLSSSRSINLVELPLPIERDDGPTAA